MHRAMPSVLSVLLLCSHALVEGNAHPPGLCIRLFHNDGHGVQETFVTVACFEHLGQPMVGLRLRPLEIHESEPHETQTFTSPVQSSEICKKTKQIDQGF